MATNPITDDDLRAAALEPEEIEGDAGRIKQRSIGELLAAKEHLDASTAEIRNHGGLRITKLIPEGGL